MIGKMLRRMHMLHAEKLSQNPLYGKTKSSVTVLDLFGDCLSFTDLFAPALADLADFLLHTLLPFFFCPLFFSKLVLGFFLFCDYRTTVARPSALIARQLPLHELLEGSFTLLAQLLERACFGNLSIVANADDRVGALNRRQAVSN